MSPVGVGHGSEIPVSLSQRHIITLSPLNQVLYHLEEPRKVNPEARGSIKAISSAFP